MKRILTLCLLAVTMCAVAQQKKVAVYVTGQESGINKVLGDQLVASFAKSGKYTAIERTVSFLTELSKEQDYQHTGAVNDNEIARLGIQFGVNYVCVADISDVFGEKYITARLIDVETAEIINTHNVSGAMNSMNSCLQMASEIAEYLSKGSFAEQAIEEQQKEILRKQREEQERLESVRRTNETRLNSLRNEGYIDLGLPSGTWWKVNPESTTEIYFSSVQNRSLLPTRRQAEELIQYCQWKRSGHGLVAIGPNGNSISFPATYTFKDWGKTKYSAHYFISEQGSVMRFFDSSSDLSIGPWDYKAAVRYVIVP